MFLPKTAADPTYQGDLGNGLVCRWSTAADTEQIVELCNQIFRYNEFVVNHIRLLMGGDHYLMDSGDFAVVEDTKKAGNTLVACTCLWHMQWSYAGIPFPMGRPEIVASDPAYRNKGLIRTLMEMIHTRSETKGHLVQGITGIPYFYRQFGYEYALDLGGKRAIHHQLIPPLPEGEHEPYTLRKANTADIPLLMKYCNNRQPGSLLWNHVTEGDWQYELTTTKKEHLVLEKINTYMMIVDTSSAVKGYVACETRRNTSAIEVAALEIAPDVNLQTLILPLLRALRMYGLSMPIRNVDIEAFKEINLNLGRYHPIYDVVGKALAPVEEPPYAWYIRVKNVPAFIKHIAPALEKRLADSILTGYTGELKLNFYRSGLSMTFKNGYLMTAEQWDASIYDTHTYASMPALLFLQLLFGYRGLDSLRSIFPDVQANAEAALLLKILFPEQRSYIMTL